MKICPNWWNQHLDPEEDAERDSFSVQLDHWLEELTGVLGGHGQLHRLSPNTCLKDGRPSIQMIHPDFSYILEC